MIDFSAQSLARIRQVLKDRPPIEVENPQSFRATQTGFVQLLDAVSGNANVMAYDNLAWTAVGTCTLLGIDSFGNPVTLNPGQWYPSFGFGDIWFAQIGCCSVNVITNPPPPPDIVNDFIRGIGAIIGPNVHEIADLFAVVGQMTSVSPVSSRYGDVVYSVGKITETGTSFSPFVSLLQGVGQITSANKTGSTYLFDTLEGIGQITSMNATHQSQLTTFNGVGLITSTLVVPQMDFAKSVGQITDNVVQACNTQCWNVQMPIGVPDWGIVQITWDKVALQWTGSKTTVDSGTLYLLTIWLAHFGPQWVMTVTQTDTSNGQITSLVYLLTGAFDCGGDNVFALAGSPGICPANAYLCDTFTDKDGKDLTSHTMDVGPGWVAAGDGGTIFNIQNDQTQIVADKGYGYIVSDAGIYDNFVCQCDITIANPVYGGWVNQGLVCCVAAPTVTSVNRRYLAYYVGLGGGLSGELWLINEQTATFLDNQVADLIPGQTYTFKFAKQGNQIGFVVGPYALSATDPSPLTYTNFGIIAVGSEGRGGSFDNFMVYPCGNAPPTFNYDGGGSLFFSGIASEKSGFSYNGGGSLFLTGIATEKTSYSYNPSGSLFVTGLASDSSAGTAGYTYQANGSLLFTGLGGNTAGYTHIPSGSLLFTGLSTETTGYNYKPSGSLFITGLAGSAIAYTYAANGSLFFTGLADASSASSGGGASLITITSNGTYTPGAGETSVIVCYIGGGGGGGSRGGGGGGGGQIIYSAAFDVSGGPQSVVIGAGGAGDIRPGSGFIGNPGGNTSFGSDTAFGGSPGGAISSGANGGSGSGSGGGAGYNNSSFAPSGGAASGTNTNAGGSGGTGVYGPPGFPSGEQYVGGGGGGAGSAGGNSSGQVAGNGGDGLDISTLNAVFSGTYAGGGGGGAYPLMSPTAGTGGSGGGGNGGNNAVGGDGSAYGAGGGGGGGDSGNGGNGYQGVVFVYGTGSFA